MLNEKGGWIRVVEAFVAVLIIAGVIILAINQDNSGQDSDISSGVYEDQAAMLYAVQFNDTLRNSIMEIDENSLPLDLNEFPNNVKDKLEEKNPGYLTCDAKLCLLEEDCIIENAASSDIYVSQATIFATLLEYSPRKLILSCVIIE